MTPNGPMGSKTGDMVVGQELNIRRKDKGGEGVALVPSVECPLSFFTGFLASSLQTTYPSE